MLSPDERARSNDRRRRQYAEEASRYDASADRTERWLFGADHRRWICSRARGRTLEVAIGTGLNLGLYPSDVCLFAVDLTPEMMRVAIDRASEVRRDVSFCEADAQALPFRDGTFDTVVATYAMCSVPDLPLTIGEMRRVLVPGGRLLLLDHVRSSFAPFLWVQKAMERMPSRESEELTRRPRGEVEAAGFAITESGRFRAGIVERLVGVAPELGPHP
jgi:ubiquinone/menaquinone biosynthesis C-methylase UbiE